MTNEQKKYIEKHCSNKTAVEIATSLNVPRTEVEGHMRRRGEMPLKQEDMAMYYLYKNAGKITRQEAFDHLGLSAVTFDKYVRNAAIKFTDEMGPKKPKMKAPEATPKRPQALQELFEDMINAHPVKRIKDKYTQSHSPFGIADQLKEILIEIV